MCDDEKEVYVEYLDEEGRVTGAGYGDAYEEYDIVRDDLPDEEELPE